MRFNAQVLCYSRANAKFSRFCSLVDPCNNSQFEALLQLPTHQASLFSRLGSNAFDHYNSVGSFHSFPQVVF